MPLKEWRYRTSQMLEDLNFSDFNSCLLQPQKPEYMEKIRFKHTCSNEIYIIIVCLKLIFTYISIFGFLCILVLKSPEIHNFKPLCLVERERMA